MANGGRETERNKMSVKKDANKWEEEKKSKKFQT